MIKTLIIDNNINYVQYIINYIISNSTNIQICYIATNGEEALQIIKDKEFDLILLDLKIKDCDGYEFINNLSKRHIEKIPKIIILSEEIESEKLYINSSMIVDVANKKDNIDNIYKKIATIEEDICYSNSENNIKNIIINELLLLGFNFKYRGTQYILKSILFIYNENDLMLLDNLENNVYKILAMKEKTSLNNIKTNITKSANLAYLSQEKTIIDKYFKFEVKPTPKIIISTILSKIMGIK